VKVVVTARYPFRDKGRAKEFGDISTFLSPNFSPPEYSGQGAQGNASIGPSLRRNALLRMTFLIVIKGD
jgi:hypothetical protein